jgi:hypothetical protein
MRVFRPCAWLCLALLAYLSLLPSAGIEPIRQGAFELGVPAEHVIAFAGTMVMLALAYGARFGLTGLGVFLAFYGVLLELGQTFAPGRTPQVIDAIENLAGVLVGLFLVAVGRAVKQLFWRSAPAG